MSKTTPLIPEHFYHIFNRGNNRETIFKDYRNYIHFLNLYKRYIHPISETYAYCLLPNHFHILVRLKELEEAEENEGFSQKRISQPFSNLFNAYTRAFNTAYARTGSLFEKPFKRLHVQEESHLIQLVSYIHLNPEKHGLVDDYRKWHYSSYQALISNQDTLIARSEVISLFQNRRNLIESHEKEQTSGNEPEGITFTH